MSVAELERKRPDSNFRLRHAQPTEARPVHGKMTTLPHFVRNTRRDSEVDSSAAPPLLQRLTLRADLHADPLFGPYAETTVTSPRQTDHAFDSTCQSGVLNRKTGHPEAGRSDRVSENHRRRFSLSDRGGDAQLDFRAGVQSGTYNQLRTD